MIANVVPKQIKTFLRPYIRQTKKEIKHSSRALRGRIQPLSGQIRMMPHFIIIGAQKGGTTSLYRYLEHHSHIATALKKEVHFFDANFGKGLNWYRGHFPTTWYKSYVRKRRGHDLITGEASPYYICHPHAPARIKAALPQVKLIALLRNPVDRAYSHYHHQVQRGREKLSFEEAIAAEPQRLAGELEKIMADGDYLSQSHAFFSYLARGVYVDQLKMWLDVFPREQILILDSRELFTNTTATFNNVLDFLELPPWRLPEYKKKNRGLYQKMAPATREQLVEYFRPHNQRLYEYLGVTFDWDR